MGVRGCKLVGGHNRDLKVTGDRKGGWDCSGPKFQPKTSGVYSNELLPRCIITAVLKTTQR